MRTWEATPPINSCTLWGVALPHHEETLDVVDQPASIEQLMVKSLPTDRYEPCPVCGANVRVCFSTRRKRHRNGMFAYHSPGMSVVRPVQPIQYCPGGDMKAITSDQL